MRVADLSNAHYIEQPVRANGWDQLWAFLAGGMATAVLIGALGLMP